MKTLTREQARSVDRIAIEHYGIPSIVLMENAGRGVVELMERVGIQGRVVVGCGKGNNGGDGYVIARHLDIRGHDVIVYRCGTESELDGDAKINHDIAFAAEIPIEYVTEGFDHWGQLDRDIRAADWVVDAILGTGATGVPRTPADGFITRANDAGQPKKLAVDVPSGLDCNTGQQYQPTFRADFTCTFVAAKPGLLMTSPANVIGELHVVDIGVPRKLLKAFGL